MARHPELHPSHRVRTAIVGAALALALALALAFALAGCAAEPPEPAPTPSAPAVDVQPSPTPALTETPAVALVPEGTAAENLPFFTSVVAGVWGSADKAAGRAYIDALTAAGFDKAGMQVTYDESTVGNPAESIQFSVRWGEECLVGQVGPATGEPVTAVLPALAEGTCLVGDTRPIDW